MISFDLDMTLLNHADYRIPDSAMTALGKLRENGHRIVIATGRDMDNYYSRRYRDLIRADAIIHLNGTKVTAGGSLLFEHHFDRALLEELLSFCEKKGYAIGMTLGDDDYYIHPEVVRQMDIERWGSCGRQFRDPGELLRMPVRTLAMLGHEEQIRDAEKAFPSLKFPMFSTGTGADVIERGYSKADALVRLAGYFGEDPSLRDTVAFGDGMNDIEVIRAAGTGVAMGNACPELKAAADYITDPIDRDGVYNACVKLGLI